MEITSYTAPKTILFANEPKLAVSAVVGNAGLVADDDEKKILYAGTPIYGDLEDRTTAFVLAADVAAVAGDLAVDDGLAEIVSLKIDTEPSANGNVTLQLGLSSEVVIAVLDADLKAGVATKIAAGTFPGYTAAVDAEDDENVVFTADEAGYRPAPIIGYASTGVTGTVTEDVKGGSDTLVDPSAASSNAVGVALHDVDVTDGNVNSQILLFGFINLDKLETAIEALITTGVKNKLAGKITFLK